MPLPAVAGVALGAAATVKKLLRVPSHIRAQKVGAALYQLAASGDAAARTELGRLTREAATSRAKGVYLQYFNALPPAAATKSAPAGKRQASAAPKEPPAGRSAARSSRGRVPSRGRQYVRYNPATGDKVKVYQDEPEYDAWPAKKPRSLTSSRGRRTESGRQVDRIASQVTRDALKGGIRLAAKGAGAIATVAAGAGISVAALTGIVLAAGAASYFGTRFLLDKYGERQAQRLAGSDIALGYRRARESFERQHYGRVGSPPGTLMTPTEHKALAEMFKSALADRGIPTTGVR